MTTSQIALEKFEASGKKVKHHNIILWVLEKYGPLTNYGIAKKAYYKGKDNFGNPQTYKLSYHAVARRTSELIDMGRIEWIGREKDSDGATRNLYDLK